MTPDAPAKEGEWQFANAGLEEIVLPCGTFSGSLKTTKTRPGPDQVFNTWFVKNIGLVRRVCVGTGVTETLVRYKIAEAAAGKKE